MPRPDAPTALLAIADVNVKTPEDGLTRDLDLKLLVDVIFLDIAAAVRALLGADCRRGLYEQE